MARVNVFMSDERLKAGDWNPVAIIRRSRETDWRGAG